MEELEEIEIVPGKGKVRIYPKHRSGRRGEFAAYVEVPAASAVARRGRRIKSPWLPALAARALVFDHHGPFSSKRSASVQALEWLRRAGKVREPVRTIITEPPLDADMTLATLQLIKGPAPKPVVLGIDIEDRKSAVALWDRIKSGHLEFGAAVPVLRTVNQVNEEYSGPWFGDDTEEFAEALIEAIRRTSEIIKDIKDGKIDPAEEGRRWVKEFESWAERAIEQGEVIEEMEVGGYRVMFAEDIPPTALYVRGADIAVAHGQGRVTIGISPTSEVSLDLRELFKWLSKKHRPGWGGRNDVGGSPKGYDVSREEFEEKIVPLVRRWLERKLG